MKDIFKEILKRFKSPVVWLSIVAVIYNLVLKETLKLPEWTEIASYIALLFGVTNNPSDQNNF